MEVGKVIGTIWATRKDEHLSGLKMMVIQPLNIVSGQDRGAPIVAVDTIGAGEGDVVILVGGSSARSAAGGRDIPVDATVVGIVDSHELAESPFKLS